MQGGQLPDTGWQASPSRSLSLIESVPESTSDLVQLSVRYVVGSKGLSYDLAPLRISKDFVKDPKTS